MVDVDETPPKAPRWVRVLAIGAVALAVLVGVLLLTGGPGEHGPGRHSGGGNTPAGDTGGQSPPAQGHTPPPGAEGHQPPPGSHAPPETTP